MQRYQNNILVTLVQALKYFSLSLLSYVLSSIQVQVQLILGLKIALLHSWSHFYKCICVPILQECSKLKKTKNEVAKVKNENKKDAQCFKLGSVILVLILKRPPPQKKEKKKIADADFRLIYFFC